jgi:hypothetical protein
MPDEPQVKRGRLPGRRRPLWLEVQQADLPGAGLLLRRAIGACLAPHCLSKDSASWISLERHARCIVRERHQGRFKVIRALLAGAVIGIIGKKLFDEGKLDPYLESLQSKAEELGLPARSVKQAAPSKNAAA